MDVTEWFVATQRGHRLVQTPPPARDAQACVDQSIWDKLCVDQSIWAKLV